MDETVRAAHVGRSCRGRRRRHTSSPGSISQAGSWDPPAGIHGAVSVEIRRNPAPSCARAAPAAITPLS